MFIIRSADLISTHSAEGVALWNALTGASVEVIILKNMQDPPVVVKMRHQDVGLYKILGCIIHGRFQRSPDSLGLM